LLGWSANWFECVRTTDVSDAFRRFISAFEQLAKASNGRLSAAGHKMDAIKPDDAVLAEMHQDGLDARSAFRVWRSTQGDLHRS